MKTRVRSKKKMNIVSIWITVIFSVIAVTLISLFITVYSALLQDELHYTLRDQSAILTDNADAQLVTDLQYQALQRLAALDASTGYISELALDEHPSASAILSVSAYCAETNAYLRASDRLALYFPSTDMVVDSRSVFFLSDKKYATLEAPYTYLKSYYPADARYLRHTVIEAEGTETSYLTFLRTYPGVYVQGQQPLLVISIEESHLHTLLRQSLRTLAKDDFILLADKNGMIFSAEDPTLIGSTLPPSSALRTLTLANGQEVLPAETLSSTGQWYYVLAHATNNVPLLAHIPVVSIWAFLCIAMLVIGLALVLSLLMKHYAHPMNRLMQHFSLADSAEGGKLLASPRDHFLQIETALSDLNKVRQNHEAFLSSNRPQLRSWWLNCFIRGEANYIAPQPHLDLAFPHPHFQAAVVSPQPSEDVLAQILAAFDPQQFVVAAFESLEKECVLLINHAMDADALPAQLESIAAQVDPDGELVFGVGVFAPTEELVPASYRCARRALASRYFEKQQRVCVFDPNAPYTEAKSVISLVLPQLTGLVSLIRHQSEEEVNQAIDSIIDQLKESSPYPAIMRSVMLLAAMFLTKGVYDMHGSPERVFGENLMEAYYHIEGISAFSARLKQDSALLSAYLSEESSPGNRSVVQYAIHHIRTCPPSELVIQSIATALSVSTGHLSRVFHQETGRKLVDYLQEVRMEHAARLLAEGQMTNDEICEYVGYSRLQYFSTKFKDHFGLTPNEYRRQHQISGNR